MKVIMITMKDCEKCHQAKELLGEDDRISEIDINSKDAQTLGAKYQIMDKTAPIFLFPNNDGGYEIVDSVIKARKRLRMDVALKHLGYI